MMVGVNHDHVIRMQCRAHVPETERLGLSAGRGHNAACADGRVGRQPAKRAREADRKRK